MANDTVTAAETVRQETLAKVAGQLPAGPKMSPEALKAQAAKIAERRAAAPPAAEPAKAVEPAPAPEPEAAPETAVGAAPEPATKAPEADAPLPQMVAQAAEVERQRQAGAHTHAVADPYAHAHTIASPGASVDAGISPHSHGIVAPGALAGGAVLGIPSALTPEPGVKIKHTDLATGVIAYLIENAPSFHHAMAALRIVESRFPGDWTRALSARKAAALVE